MDYFEIAKGVTSACGKHLMREDHLRKLQAVIEEQDKLITEQKELIAMLKAALAEVRQP